VKLSKKLEGSKKSGGHGPPRSPLRTATDGDLDRDFATG